MKTSLYERAIAALWLQRGDARALAAAAVAAEPGVVAPRLLEAALLVTSRDVHDFEAAGWAYARLRGLAMNERERAHASALEAAVDGDYERACLAYDRILFSAPRSLAHARGIAKVVIHELRRPERERVGRRTG